MNARTSYLSTLAACALLAAGLATAARSASPAPAVAKAPAAAFHMTESLGEKVTAERPDGELVLQEVDGGRFRMDYTLPLDGSDISTFDGTTQLSVFVDGWTYQTTLGSDPAYRPGMRRAKVLLYSQDEQHHALTIGWAVLTWNRRALTVQLDGRTGNESYLEPVLAEQFMNSPVGPVAAMGPAHIGFGGASADFDISIRGRVTHRPVTVDGVPFDRPAVTLNVIGVPQ